jgi:hypothetical protein
MGEINTIFLVGKPEEKTRLLGRLRRRVGRILLE